MASSIKVAYDGEMRRFAASTYEDLQERVSNLFGLESFLLKYQDEEGDLVTVSSEWELEEALRCQGPVLRLNVEISEDRQSGDFILVQKECVVHIDESADEKSDSFPSPLATEQLTTSEETSPMALTPLPEAPAEPAAKEAPKEASLANNLGTKRSYAEACESKTPYIQGAHKVPTYIISVSARALEKAHSPGTKYTQSLLAEPYAKGKDGPEFAQTAKASQPYAKGKQTKPYTQPKADAHYASQAQASRPFTQVK